MLTNNNTSKERAQDALIEEGKKLLGGIYSPFLKKFFPNINHNFLFQIDEQKYEANALREFYINSNKAIFNEIINLSSCDSFSAISMGSSSTQTNDVKPYTNFCIKRGTSDFKLSEKDFEKVINEIIGMISNIKQKVVVFFNSVGYLVNLVDDNNFGLQLVTPKNYSNIIKKSPTYHKKKCPNGNKNVDLLMRTNWNSLWSKLLKIFPEKTFIIKKRTEPKLQNFWITGVPLGKSNYICDFSGGQMKFYDSKFELVFTSDISCNSLFSNDNIKKIYHNDISPLTDFFNKLLLLKEELAKNNIAWNEIKFYQTGKMREYWNKSI